MNPKKELLWGLWVVIIRFSRYSGAFIITVGIWSIRFKLRELCSDKGILLLIVPNPI